LEAVQLRDDVNLVIVSDHGMTPISIDRVIFLDQYINMSNVRLVDTIPLQLFPYQPGIEQDIVDSLAQHPNITAYLKQNTPQEWHYKSNVRIAPIIATLDEGWSATLTTMFNSSRHYFEGPSSTHGYVPNLPSMRSIFIANGPDFASGKILPPFENIHVYSTLCKILQLNPAPNNGTAVVEALAST